MRLATSPLAVAIVLCSTVAFAANPTSNRHEAVSKDTATGVVPNPIHANQGGDTIATATVIGALPYNDAGTTTGYADNYSPTCYFAGGAPDVVYSFSPGANVSINIALCGSTYDTGVFVYQDVAGNVVGCNDDSCGLQSQILHLALLGGHTYYIVVDGYSSSNGAYTLAITEDIPCVVDCPSGALAEGEPDCFDNADDYFNGGCNSVPPVFTPLPCNPEGEVTVCGTYGGFLYTGLSYRDTDWYQISLAAPTAITWCVNGQYPTILGIIDGRLGCPVSAFYSYTTTTECVPACVSEVLPAGTWWLFSATSGFGPAAGACGGKYTATLSGYVCGTVSVEPKSWGTIKSDYR